jgi:deoxyribose-phosphate aldolase
MNIAPYIEYTLLHPTTLADNIKKLCAEATENDFAAVSVPPLFVKTCKTILAESNVKVGTVIGFPFGYSVVEAKLAETVLAMVDGADELEVAVNCMAIKNNDWGYVANELNHILPLVRKQEKKIKILIEASLLTDDELKKCCDLYGAAGIDYLSVSTGFTEENITPEKIRMIRLYLADHVKIKTAGDIETTAYAQQLLDAGVYRLGCKRLLV